MLCLVLARYFDAYKLLCNWPLYVFMLLCTFVGVAMTDKVISKYAVFSLNTLYKSIELG